MKARKLGAIRPLPPPSCPRVIKTYAFGVVVKTEKRCVCGKDCHV